MVFIPGTVYGYTLLYNNFLRAVMDNSPIKTEANNIFFNILSSSINQAISAINCIKIKQKLMIFNLVRAFLIVVWN